MWHKFGLTTVPQRTRNFYVIARPGVADGCDVWNRFYPTREGHLDHICQFLQWSPKHRSCRAKSDTIASSFFMPSAIREVILRQCNARHVWQIWSTPVKSFTQYWECCIRINCSTDAVSRQAPTPTNTFDRQLCIKCHWQLSQLPQEGFIIPSKWMFSP